jgi:hypothetical protein
MKANELRIGNYIEIKCVAKECIGDEFEVQQCNVYNIFSLYNNDKDFLCNPIPLTEEWLLKFGFVKNTGYYISEETNIEFFLSNGNIYCELHGETIFNVENVHQLQNLYHALCGSELTIKK